MVYDKSNPENSILTNAEQSRYVRQIILPEGGTSGQMRLKSARVLIVGLGGLGSPAALYLAAAGVGTLGLADADTVSLSNLQRQIIYTADNVGQRKIDVAVRQLTAMNPHVNLRLHLDGITAENACDIFTTYDVILDGTDNFSAHYLMNDAAVLTRKPLVWGNVERFAGQMGVALPGQSACYRCIYPTPPPAGMAPTCGDIGVLGVVPALIGTLQATEVLKLILAIGTPMADRILRLDALTTQFKEIKMTNDKNCAVCGDNPSITKVESMKDSCANPNEVTADQLQSMMQSTQPPLLIDVRNPDEFAASHIEGARLIPLPELTDRLGELNANDDIILHCKSGGRSARALDLLKAHGVTHVRHLKGGILAWPGENSTQQ